MAWVRTIARNKAWEHLRKQRRGPMLVDGALFKLLAQEHDSLGDAWEERRRSLEGCIEALAPRARQILELRYALEPLKPPEIAALGKALPGVFPVVGLGVDPGSAERATAYVCSAWGPNQPIPTQCRPDRAYQALFGSAAPGVGAQEFAARSQLLDFMRDDIRQVQSRLAGDEKQKFDYYLRGFETMSGRMAELKAIEPALQKHAPRETDDYASANETNRLGAQFELAAAALISGLTNVVTIMSGTAGHGGAFTGLGIEIGLHQMAHSMSDNGREPQELFTLIRKHHIGLIAGLVKKLQAVPEGDGSMMDHTLIVYTSDAAHGRHSDGSEWPFVLVGNLGGRIRGGRFIEYPGYGQLGNRTINALYAALLHAVGAPRDRFNLTGGLKDIDQPGPLAELLA